MTVAARRICPAIVLLLAAPAGAIEWPHVSITGFIQPEFEVIGISAPDKAAPNLVLTDLNVAPDARTQVIGFSQFRARGLFLGDKTIGQWRFDSRLELEALPQFTLFDAYLSARRELPEKGVLRIVAGQHKAPFSRQVLVWDPDLQMMGCSYCGSTTTGGLTKAWVTELAPGHQIGLSFSLNVPRAPWLQIMGGVFNGDGKNVLEHVDHNFLYVGRLSFRPINPTAPNVERALGDDQLAISANAAYRNADLGDHDEARLALGGDAFVSFRGLSAYVELVWAQTKWALHAGKANSCPPGSPNCNDFASLGWNAQAGYLLPIPGYLYRRLEITARGQYIVRNDNVAISAPGDPNQPHYDAAFGLNYYHLGHGLKAMLNYNHFVIPVDAAREVSRKSAYAWDALFLMLSYKLE